MNEKYAIRISDYKTGMIIQSDNIDLSDCFVWVNIGNAPSPKEYHSFIKTIPIKVYPNPAMVGPVTFKFENTEHHRNIELRCFDVFGKLVHSETVYRYQGESKVNINNLNPGMYVALVYSEGKVVGQCKFVVK